MRVLLDECLPRKLKRHLAGHAVSTVPEMGWAGISNGALLILMEPGFDVFITIDGNMEYQQNLIAQNIGIVVLQAPDNSLETLQPLALEVLRVIDGISPGDVVKVSC